MSQLRFDRSPERAGSVASPAAATRVGEPTAAFVVVSSVALVAYNSVSHLVPAINVIYVPMNLLVAVLIAWVARRRGLTRADVGLDAIHIRSGLRWGMGVAVLAAAAMAVSVLVPAFHPILADARVGEMGFGLLAYRALIRIPLGTALLEEFAFRGVLFGAWARIAGPAPAAVGSSLVFGLWHVRPTVELLAANAAGMSGVAQVGAIAAGVVATALAGYGFSQLRLRSGSLLAPFVAHAAISALALTAAGVAGG